MPIPPFRLGVAAAVIAALTACDDPLRPEDVAGTYVLREVRGQPIPAVMWASDVVQLRVFADTLRLNADGTGSETWLLEFTGTFESGPEVSSRLLQFEVHDRRLEGTYLCFGFCLAVVEPIRGTFTLTGLRLDVGLHRIGPLEFVRADPRRL